MRFVCKLLYNCSTVHLCNGSLFALHVGQDKHEQGCQGARLAVRQTSDVHMVEQLRDEGLAAEEVRLRPTTSNWLVSNHWQHQRRTHHNATLTLPMCRRRMCSAKRAHVAGPSHGILLP